MPQPPTMRQTSSVEPGLRRAAALFRVLAVGWMAVMAGITLASDPGAAGLVVAAAIVVAVAAGGVAVRHLLRRPATPAFILWDGVVALAVAFAPQVAGAGSPFFGGYPMSWVVIVALTGLGRGLAAAGAFVATQVAGWVLGAPSVGALGDLVSVAVLAAVVAGVVAAGADHLRSEELRRLAVEDQLEVERRERLVAQARSEERLAVADDLHDSLLQTVRVIGLAAQEPERVRSLARRHERELQAMIERMHGSGQDGAAAALRAEATDVEELFGIQIDVVAVGDAEMDDGVADLVRSAREVMVNAARHSGAGRVDVTLEVSAAAVVVVVRDTGAGFDPDLIDGGHGLGAVRARSEKAGGGMSIISSPGAGSEIELRVPRAG